MPVYYRRSLEVRTLTSEPARSMLKRIRTAVKAAAPMAEERISYRMPYYHYRGRVAYFAAFKDHVSLFAMPGRAPDDIGAALRP